MPSRPWWERAAASVRAALSLGEAPVAHTAQQTRGARLGSQARDDETVVGALRLRDHAENEALVTRARLGDGSRAFFLIDTAYAGPVVLSTSYLSAARNEEGDEAVAYRGATRASGRAVSRSVDGDAAVDRLVRACATCRSFSTGCTMQLLSVGDSREHHSSLLVMPPLGLDYAIPPATPPSCGSDVMVSHALPGVVHILTLDFLVHRNPVVLLPKEETMLLHASLSRRDDFRMARVTTVAGAFSVAARVGGVPVRLVVDTGAAIPLSLGRDASRRVETLRTSQAAAVEQPNSGETSPPPSSSQQHVFQQGVNGERICSRVARMPVQLLDDEGGTPLLSFDGVDVLLNDTPFVGADGYVGFGLLRAADLWIEPRALGFRPSGLSPARTPNLRAGRCVA